jgi:hypothetical protein
MHYARVVPVSGFLAMELETGMSGKCTYLEKVGAVHFARKRIRRAGTGRVEPRDALMHPTRRLIDGQLLRPEEVIGDDLARRRVPAATVASHWQTR